MKKLRTLAALAALIATTATGVVASSLADAWQSGSLYALGDAVAATGPTWTTERPAAVLSLPDASIAVVGSAGTIWTAAGESNLGDPGAPVVDAIATANGIWGLTNDGRVLGTNVPSGGGTIGATSLAVTPSGTGGWIAHRDGTVAVLGEAPALAPMPPTRSPVVEIVATESGSGYWIVTADGGVFSFGDAAFPGSLVGRKTGPIAAATRVGPGLWLVGSDGRTWSLGTPLAPAPGNIRPVSGFFAVDLVPSNSSAVIVTAHSVRPDKMLAALPANSGTGRRIVYSNSLQQVWIINADESVERTYLVSGKVATPAPGRYRVQSKSTTAQARNGSAWMRWMVRFNGGIGFHQIPQKGPNPMQTETELGYYRSHGCVRQAAEDAHFLFLWSTVGTPVIVLD
jgi:L,D-transpeptidase catalytic domain